MKRILFAVLLLTGAAPRLFAANYKIDTAHSSVSFKIRHLVSKVRGSFDDFSGSFSYDPKKVKKSSLEVIIKTASINTGNKKRDGHLRNKDFFDAKKYPTITFSFSKAKKKGKGRFKVFGTLDMHGHKKPVVFDVEYAGEAKDSRGKIRAGFSATGKLNRKDFDIVYNHTLETGGLLLGEEVEFSIEIEAVKEE